MSANALIITTFVVYLLAMFAIGLLAWRRTTDLADYFLGGRRLGKWVAALSAQASDMSGWLLLGLPGYAYVSGLEAGWLALGLLIGAWLNWRFIAAPLRIASAQAEDAITLPAFFAHRFGDTTPVLRAVSAVLILVFFLFYTSAGLVAGGKLFEAAFGLPYLYAVSAGLGAVLAYTLFGGFLAVSWTDTVQSLLMLLALAVAAVFAVDQLGGWSEMHQTLAMNHPNLLDWMTSSSGEPLGLLTIVSLMAWGLGYFGQPHILARFMAIRSADDVPYARRVAISWSAIAMTAAIVAGLAGAAGVVAPLDDSEKVFLQLVEILFHPVIAGIALAAVLAAIMSTADSQLLVASSALTEDIVKGLFGANCDSASMIWLARGAVVFIAACAFALALSPDSGVLKLVGHAWAGFGATFGPVIVLGLHWPGTTRSGVVAGMLTGATVVMFWDQLPDPATGVYALLPGFILATVVIVVVSLATGEKRVQST